MTDTELQSLVEKSYLLSAEQRTYWLQQLPRMKPPQKAKLEKILAGTDVLPFQKLMEQYMVALGNAAQKIAAVPLSA